MMLPKLRFDLDMMLSPLDASPGLLIRDVFRYSDSTLIIPPPLVRALYFFDGTHTDSDLRVEIARSVGDDGGVQVADQLFEALSRAGFLEDRNYIKLKELRHTAFAQSSVREVAHAGFAYPRHIDALVSTMQSYLGATTSTQDGLIGVAAPHVSPAGGWQCYRAAYQVLTPELKDRTFVVLGTSHYGRPGKFGLTRKPFETPYGRTTTNVMLVRELEAQPAAIAEDYCHAVEHSIEFQVLFLQAIYGPEVKVCPILCGSFGANLYEGAMPEDDQDIECFLDALRAIAEREKERLFWILGVDMAHMGLRYGDAVAAHAYLAQMGEVAERDKLRIERVNASDADGFWQLVREKGDDLKWCGSSPVYTFMRAVPQARGTLLRYEQWNIDEQSVVSFAGISFVQR
jgi:AmmeMemoRadiSam system protein B